MSSSSKRQTTMAKRAREQAVKERRERKQEKKQAARDAKAAEGTLAPHDVADEMHSARGASSGAPVGDEGPIASVAD